MNSLRMILTRINNYLPLILAWVLFAGFEIYLNSTDVWAAAREMGVSTKGPVVLLAFGSIIGLGCVIVIVFLISIVFRSGVIFDSIKHLFHLMLASIFFPLMAQPLKLAFRCSNMEIGVYILYAIPFTMIFVAMLKVALSFDDSAEHETIKTEDKNVIISILAATILVSLTAICWPA